MCADKPTANWWAWEVMSEGWYFLGNNQALRSVFSIKLLKGFEHFSSVTSDVIPHLFVDVHVLVHAWSSVQWRCYSSAGIWVTNTKLCGPFLHVSLFCPVFDGNINHRATAKNQFCSPEVLQPLRPTAWILHCLISKVIMYSVWALLRLDHLEKKKSTAMAFLPQLGSSGKEEESLVFYWKELENCLH